MSLRRLAALYGFFLLAFFVVVCRVFSVAQNKTYAARASSQTVTTLPLEKKRGDFFDCEGNRLTGILLDYYALCIPGEENYARLYDCCSVSGQNELYARRNSASPFLIEVQRDLNAQGIFTVHTARRYYEVPICEHLIGYLDSAGKGVTGLEAACEEILAQNSADAVRCTTTAQGRLLEGTDPMLCFTSDTMKGVELTISREIQRAAEGVAAATMTTGAILVLDTNTAKVRACVSMPRFSPENVQKSIAANDSSLLNRAFCAYNVGSVFKPVLAAAALEENKASLSIDCVGYTDLNGQIYRCAGGVPHGKTDLAHALQKSCNGYFIALGQKLGPQTVARYAQSFGFGEPVYLTQNLKAAAGNLPSVDTLADLGQLANFSFGQGQLLATPVQLAGMMNTIAANGVYRTPGFLEGIVEERDESGRETAAGEKPTFLESLSQPETRTVMRAANAKALQQMLAAVVSDGIGKEAQPLEGSAAGKTGTAQTGRFNAEGQELKNLWFAGFYPAEAPSYTIVVLQDDQIRAEYSSAAIFAKLCNALALLKNG